MDAIRICDGTVVAMKRIEAGSTELEICRYVSSKERSEDADNHRVPILDEFPDREIPNLHFIIMPFLRICYDPPFWSVDEVIDFVKQTLTVRYYYLPSIHHEVIVFIGTCVSS